jgi:hypothetical protein
MPTPSRWDVPVALSPEEARVAALLHRVGKFYVFLRAVRTELFDEAFQTALAAAYQPRGTAPLPAALLAMVTLLQAYDQVSDAEAVVAARVDSANGVGFDDRDARRSGRGSAGERPRHGDRIHRSVLPERADEKRPNQLTDTQRHRFGGAFLCARAE